MEENTFSLKCDARAVKVNYDSGDHISVIKVYPEQKSDVKIVSGRQLVSIQDGKPKARRKTE